MMPFDTLVELFRIATEHGFDRATPPTLPSVERIQRELGIVIPADYIRLAGVCPSYGSLLAGIGGDFDGDIHILRLNALFRAEGLPKHFVLLDHGHDGDCDCWDLRETTSSGEHPIVYVGLDGTRPCRETRFESFRAYIENFVVMNAGRNPKPASRRRAKRIIQELQL